LSNKQTIVAKNEHLAPTWTGELSFRLNGADVIHFEVWNKETLTKDDLIGTGSLFVSTFANKGFFNEWIPLTFEGKPAGEILVEVQFFPDSGNLGLNQQNVNMTSKNINQGMPGTFGFVSGQNQGFSSQPQYSGSTGSFPSGGYNQQYK